MLNQGSLWIRQHLCAARDQVAAAAAAAAAAAVAVAVLFLRVRLSWLGWLGTIQAGRLRTLLGGSPLLFYFHWRFLEDTNFIKVVVLSIYSLCYFE